MPLSSRAKLIQKILWLSHQTGKEITEDTLFSGYYSDNINDEATFLKDLYKGLLVRYRNHQLPLVTDECDI